METETTPIRDREMNTTLAALRYWQDATRPARFMPADFAIEAHPEVGRVFVPREGVDHICRRLQQIREKKTGTTPGTGTVPVPVRTLWAAYTGSAGAGSDISLHRTEREALEACYVALLYDEEDPSGRFPDPKLLDDEDLREKLEYACGGASDWAVCEVTLP